MNKPLLLKPAAKNYLWGGSRLNDDFGKKIALSPLAETWECSTHPDGQSVVGRNRRAARRGTGEASGISRNASASAYGGKSRATHLD